MWKDFPKQFGINSSNSIKLEGAGGHNLNHYGERIVKGSVDGTKVSIRFQVADVDEPILSVPVLTKSGFKTFFGQDNAYIRAPCGAKTKLLYYRGLYYLPFKIEGVSNC